MRRQEELRIILECFAQEPRFKKGKVCENCEGDKDIALCVFCRGYRLADIYVYLRTDEKFRDKVEKALKDAEKVEQCMIGIYKITNTANGKVYIGQTNDIERRRNQHFSALQSGHHENKDMQQDFNR